MIKSLTWRPPAVSWQPGRHPRLVAATLLRAASSILARLARQLAPRSGKTDPLAVALEFYAEAGAPEGALYADGKLVGYVSGVTRL
jgi:hypothetical protein